MEHILYGYQLNATTWVYLSSLLTIAIYFKFSRLWSIRNFDLLVLIAQAPGLLMVVQEGDVAYWGYVWLFASGGVLLLRMLFDARMVRRPLLEPNLSAGGMTFIAASLAVFMMVNVLTNTVDPRDLEGPQQLDKMLFGAEPRPDDKVVAQHGPGYSLLHWIPSITTKTALSLKDPPVTAEQDRYRYTVQAATARTMAILSHLAVVLGVVVIGVWHFDNIRTGLAAATLYLLMPYTAVMTGRVDHVLPAALMTWAVALYRRPLASGMLLGLATGAVYYPFFLLPLWLSFYWHRGLMRFICGFASMLALMVVPLALTSANADLFLTQMKMMFGWPDPKMPGAEGFWRFHMVNEYFYLYRIPVLAAFVALSISFAIWPVRKNLGTLLSGSAALMLGTQFWNAHDGGIYIAWYLPLLLLTIFRPNLEDRVALATLGEGWLARRRTMSRKRAA
ncbi:MAG TPA: hypothetical protein VND64_28375 [Pirellulales bacterium]|nr:hypothetical protein [Pirellulales bacterium]